MCYENSFTENSLSSFSWFILLVFLIYQKKRNMKKSIFIFTTALFLLSCGEEKTTLEKVIEQKCNCLELLNEEKDNIMEVLACSDEIANKAEYAKLDPQEIAEGMEKHCPNAALPDEAFQQ